MTDKEELQEIWEERKKIENKKDYIRDMIEGVLNRISVTDDENERDKAPEHISHYVTQYLELSRKSHKLFKEFNKGLGIEQ